MRIGMCFAVVVAAAWTACTASAQEVRHYALGTATSGGTYYPVGVAIEALVQAVLQDSHGVAVQARATGGSVANLELLDSDDVQFAMVQGIHTRPDFADPDTHAGSENPVALRSVSMLWPDVFHILVRADLAKTGSVHDLADIGAAPFAPGRPDSGARLSTEVVLAALGVDTGRLNVVDVGGYDAVAAAFESQRIAAGSLVGGVPMAAIARALSTPSADLAFLSFSDEDVTAVNAGMAALWIRYVVAAGSYPGLDADLPTIAEPNALLVRADVPADDVYLLTKTIFQNLSFLANMHPAARQISPDRALLGMAIPLHPGALRYFEEIGLTIPDDLRPPAE